MKLIVNGKAHVHNGPATVSVLLRNLKVNGNRVAIMVNDNIIAGRERARFPLKEGDKIELLTFAGGG